MKNESMYSPSHIWHKDPFMDNMKGQTKSHGSNDPTEIWKNANGNNKSNSTVMAHGNSTQITTTNQDEKINRIEATLKKIAELLNNF